MKIFFKFIGLILAISFLSYLALSLYSGTGGEIPAIAKQYVSTFRHLLDSFLTSHWFFVVFSAGWLGVSYTLGKESGWQNLAKKHSYKSQSDTPKTFYTGNGYIGNIRYNGILQISANNRGIYLRIFFPFRFGHKKLFLTWRDIASITLENGLFSDKTPGFLKKIGKSLSKTEYLDIKLNQFPEQRLTIQSFDKIRGLIPQNIKR